MCFHKQRSFDYYFFIALCHSDLQEENVQDF